MNKFQIMVVVCITSLILLSMVFVNHDSTKIIFSSQELADDLNGFLVSTSNADIVSISTDDDEFILKIEITASDDGILVLHNPLRYLQNVYGEKDMVVLFLADQTEIVHEWKDNNAEIPFEKGTRLIEVVGGIPLI